MYLFLNQQHRETRFGADLTAYLPAPDGPGLWFADGGFAWSDVQVATTPAALMFLAEVDAAGGRVRLVRRVHKWDRWGARLFACDCAEHALTHIKGPRAGSIGILETARDYVFGSVLLAGLNTARHQAKRFRDRSVKAVASAGMANHAEAVALAYAAKAVVACLHRWAANGAAQASEASAYSVSHATGVPLNFEWQSINLLYWAGELDDATEALAAENTKLSEAIDSMETQCLELATRRDRLLSSMAVERVN